MFKNIRSYENLHIALWLVKDACWVMLWRPLGMIMIVPTIFVAFHIAWKSRKDLSELFHNIAVCLWICANATWMTGEFYYDDGLRPFAAAFFMAGIGVIAVYYAILLPHSKKKLKMTAQGNSEPEVLNAAA